MKYAKMPVSVVGLNYENIKHWYKRPYKEQSTYFTYSRFLVPFLSGYEGTSIFMDCDMILRDDIYKIFNDLSEDYAVACVKHDYEPKSSRKFFGSIQTKYSKKNWSSVMVFQNRHCKILTPNYVNEASGEYLHQFKWTHESLIESLALEWNHLVNEYPHNPDAKIVHFTEGGPYFYNYHKCEYAFEWWALWREVNRVGETILTDQHK